MKRILVALDASPRTPGVREAASERARETGARLVLFRSVGLPTHVDEEAVTHTGASLPDALQKEAEVDLARHAAACPPELVERTIVHLGVPWEAICSAAKEVDADLIVIGSHGYSGLDRLMGTTASKVVNHSDRSVLVVRPRPAPSA
jgi:nucleotide-binding universal stress UspA family protein